MVSSRVSWGATHYAELHHFSKATPNHEPWHIMLKWKIEVLPLRSIFRLILYLHHTDFRNMKSLCNVCNKNRVNKLKKCFSCLTAIDSFFLRCRNYLQIFHTSLLENQEGWRRNVLGFFFFLEDSWSFLLMPLMLNRLHLNISVSIYNDILELPLCSLKTSGYFRNNIQNVVSLFIPLMWLLGCVHFGLSVWFL